MHSLTLDENILESWVGKTRSTTDTIDVSAGRRMASLLGTELDESEPLPALWHWLYFHESVNTEQLGVDGHARLGDFLPPVDLPRRMWAGGRLNFQQAIRFGDSINKHSQVLDVKRKKGGSGELCFVTVKHSFSRAGHLLMTEEHDIVYRENPEHIKPVDEALPVRSSARLISDSADGALLITPSVTALFRYSALTFNSHRIHFDRGYCREVEQYKGLVFHGPLTATLLAALAQSRLQTPLASFSFRAINPVFDTDTFLIDGEVNANECSLTARFSDGTEIMCAEAIASTQG